MGTVAKALNLLNLLSPERPQIGLSEYARLAGHDKATTYRLLSQLLDCGFLQQDAASKDYRLGPAVLRLANVRERTMPGRQAALPILDELCATTGETVHLSLLEGWELATIAYRESTSHSTRVYIDEAERLPLHATASGMVVLAFSSAAFVDEALARPLARHTATTITDPAEILGHIEAYGKTGLAKALGSFEADVIGMAAPLFDANASCIGAVAVATPAARMSEELATTIKTALKHASTAIVEQWGGTLPGRLEEAWGHA